MAEPILDSSWVLGLDVSHYQGRVDWARVARQVYKFAFIKASEGTTLPDPEFSANWNGAQAVGLLRGAYHYFEPGRNPEQQAEFFLNTVWPAGGQPLLEVGDLPPVLDVEPSRDQCTEEVAQEIQTWIAVVQHRTLRIPILYTARDLWDGLGIRHLGSSPLWVSEYGVAAPSVLPAGWWRWQFWQYSQRGRVDGIERAVDLDVYQGSLESLRQMAALF